MHDWHLHQGFPSFLTCVSSQNGGSVDLEFISSNKSQKLKQGTFYASKTFHDKNCLWSQIFTGRDFFAAQKYHRAAFLIINDDHETVNISCSLNIIHKTGISRERYFVTQNYIFKNYIHFNNHSQNPHQQLWRETLWNIKYSMTCKFTKL